MDGLITKPVNVLAAGVAAASTPASLPAGGSESCPYCKGRGTLTVATHEPGGTKQITCQCQGGGANSNLITK